MQSYNQVLALARAGNPVRAWDLFCELGATDASPGVQALTLKGRLLKDLGQRATGEEQLRLFSEASQAYLAANALKSDTYPLINAATLALLSEDFALAQELARQVLALIEADPEEGETPYWREATKAEALLLLGQTEKAEEALATGIARLPRAWEDHAATIGQFERIISARGTDPGWLDAYRPSASVHFSGLIGLDPEDPDLHDAIARIVSDLSPGFAYGALAAGADILLAERLLEGGASLHVILPFARDQFRQLSVEPYGEHWCARYDALLEEAEIVEELREVDGDAADWLGPLVDAANLAAMGQCVRRAEALRSRAHAIAIKGVGEPERSHLAAWREAGFETHLVETKRTAGVSRSAPELAAATAIPSTLFVQGGDPEAFASLPSGQTLRIERGAAGTRLIGDIRACLAALVDLHKTRKVMAAGLVVNPFDTVSALRSAGELAARLAQAAGEGALYADHQTAMIAKVLNPGNRVEEMGEVGTLAGPLTVYAITWR